MAITMYGIKNCDTIKKARKYLDQLDDKTKTSVTDKTAVALLCEHPAMIKRPVLKNGANTLVGFSADSYADFLKLVS